MSYYPHEPRNLTVADVERLIRDFLRSQSARSSYAPKGTPWQSIDLPLVTAFPLYPQDRDEVNLLNETSDEVTRWIYVARKARWLQIGGAPIGVVEFTAASDAPLGYVIADGSTISRTTYAGLFAVIGTQYGSGDGSTTFDLPDLAGRFAFGRDFGPTGLGATGGAVEVTLATANLPSHTHSISSSGSHTHPASSAAFALTNFVGQVAAGTDFGAVNAQAASTGSGGSHDHGGATGSAGSGTAHENMPPFLALTPIIRT